MDTYSHISVLLEESIQALNPQENGVYLDCTLGLGGHSERIMQQTHGKAKVIALDRDSNALQIAKKRLACYGDAMCYYHLPFSQFVDALNAENCSTVNGIILDAGISSMQLDDIERGFTFMHDAPLDMRMDTTIGITAERVLAESSFETLRTILQEYGEEPLATKIARAITHAREKQPIQRTKQLVSIIENVFPAHWKRTARTHPATRTFQALRIYVNNELNELHSFLDNIIPFLAPHAIIAIISFHSLEDRIVKHTFKRYTIDCICPSHVLRCECNHVPSLRIITKKPIIPSLLEIQVNPKARSAKMRLAQKV